MRFDFASVTSPFRMQPGLRRLAPDATQLTPCELDAPHLIAKHAVLSRPLPGVLLAVPGFDPRPCLRAVMARAVHEHPTAFTWDGADGFVAQRLGWSLAGVEVHGDGPAHIGEFLRALPPARRAAGLLSLAFEEDFAVIDGATTRLPWLAVCLPSHWAPEDKLGRRFAEVHAPVADNATLLAAGEHLARLVTGPERWERFVWTITPRASLDAHPARTPPAHWSASDDADDLAAAAFLRTERQTFIPLVAPRCLAVFTIRIAVHPLADAVVTPLDARRLRDALASMSPAVLAYRGLADARERLLCWLDRRAG